MKIRSKEDCINRIEQDLAWRKKELTSLNIDVQSASEKLLPKALRCASVMLYAHWEGFVKNSTQYYLNYVKYQGLSLNQVNTSILALSLKQRLSQFEETNKATLHVQFLDYVQSGLSDKVDFSDTYSIRTGSNLNSNILKEIYATVGLDVSYYELRFKLIDQQLLKNRNDIAHGSEPPLNKSDYNHLHREIVEMIDHVRTDLCNAVSTGLFRKQP